MMNKLLIIRALVLALVLALLFVPPFLFPEASSSDFFLCYIGGYFSFYISFNLLDYMMANESSKASKAAAQKFLESLENQKQENEE